LLLKFTCPELAGDKCTVVTQSKSRASASSATPAYSILLLKFTCPELAGDKCTVVTQSKSNVYANFTTGAYLVLLRFLPAESKQGVNAL